MAPQFTDSFTEPSADVAGHQHVSSAVVAGHFRPRFPSNPQEQEGHAEGDPLTIPTAASAQQRVTEYDFQTVAASYSLRFKRDVDAVNHADGD